MFRRIRGKPNQIWVIVASKNILLIKEIKPFIILRFDCEVAKKELEAEQKLIKDAAGGQVQTDAAATAVVAGTS